MTVKENLILKTTLKISESIYIFDDAKIDVLRGLVCSSDSSLKNQ